MCFCLFSLHASAQQFTYLPPGIEADSMHAPFYHGVASGDPTGEHVILWTRITPMPSQQSSVLDVQWQISADENFTSILQSGTTSTDSTVDFTVKVDVGGLSSDTYYYYRFIG